MTSIRSRIPCLAAFALAAAAAHGGDATQPVSPTPAAVRETLTDDWFGAGPAMREHGVVFSGALTQFYQGLVSGDGPKGWKYGGKVDGFLRIDGGKLGLWKGFGISAHAELNYGQSPTSAGGTFVPNNMALFFPGANETLADLSLYVSQQFGDSVTVMLGKINTVDLYAAGHEFSGGRGVELFQHVEFTGPISGITPPMILGGIVSVKTKPAKFTLMVYDPVSQTMRSGFADPFGEGITFNGSVEVPSNFFGKSGKHFFSAAYSTQNGVDFSDPYLLLPTTPPPATTDDRWYFAYAFEQTLWRDANDPKKAWGLFGQASISDANPNPIGWSALGGIGGTSPIPGRERDKFGVGYFYVGYSQDLKDTLRVFGLPVRDETGVEIFYNVAVTPWLRVTADAQFIRPPRTDRDTAIIAGMRAQILF